MGLTLVWAAPVAASCWLVRVQRRAWGPSCPTSGPNLPALAHVRAPGHRPAELGQDADDAAGGAGAPRPLLPGQGPPGGTHLHPRAAPGLWRRRRRASGGAAGAAGRVRRLLSAPCRSVCCDLCLVFCAFCVCVLPILVNASLLRVDARSRGRMRRAAPLGRAACPCGVAAACCETQLILVEPAVKLITSDAAGWEGELGSKDARILASMQRTPGGTQARGCRNCRPAVARC